MFSVPVDYACGDFILPAINDGWAGGRLAGNAGCYECAAALWPADAEIPRLLAWFYRGEPRNRVEVGAREAYSGVDIRRTVTCRDGVAGDRITAASDAEHTYDLFYHFRGDLTRCSATLAPAEIARDGSGYEWLRDVQRGSCSGRVECVIGLRDLTGHLVFEGTGAAPFEIFTGTCPDNPADRTMTFVLLRARGRNAGWTVDMKVRRSGEDP